MIMVNLFSKFFGCGYIDFISVHDCRYDIIAELVVREEADVKKISRELYNMQKSKSRSKGVSMA